MEISDRTKQILTENNLDFEISKLRSAAIIGDVSIDGDRNIMLDTGSKLIASPYFQLMNNKTGEIINSVKEGYTISQNGEIIEKVLQGMQPFGNTLSVSKALSINGGRKVIVQLEIEGESKVSSDKIKRYVTIIDSNDGSTSLSVGVSDTVFRCMNQFHRFYKSGHRFRHSASIKQQITKLPMMIEEALSQSLHQIEIYNKFVSTEVSKELAHQLVNSLLGVDRTATQKELSEMSTKAKNAMDTLYADIETEFNQVGQNAWGLFGGVTRWTTHHKVAPKRENGRIESLVLGTNYNTNYKAFEFVSALV